MSETEKAKNWLKNREKDLARSLIRYKLSRDGGTVADGASLDKAAVKVVDEANRLVKEGGKDLLSTVSGRITSYRGKGGK